MKRREFIVGLGSAAVWPVAVRAQQAERVRRIGMLSSFDDNNPYRRSHTNEMFQALLQLGWESGRTAQIIQRWGAGEIDRTAMLAKELVAMQPDVIIAVGTPATVALQRETHTIPVVFLTVSDPVGAGIVASLARPGGNITGFSNVEGGFAGKLLSLVKMIAPRTTRAAAMFKPDTATGHPLYYMGAFEDVARSLAIEPIKAGVRSDADIEQAITLLGQEHGGLVAFPDTFVNVHRGTVIASSIRNNVPVIFDGIGFAKDGGLLEYGPNWAAMYRRSAFYVDRILRGGKPNDLPVELPTRYWLVINRKTARALDREIPDNLLALADEVIE
jgi:putative tryptophan/tyrosine transport system substrate-binding protein